MKMLLVVVFYKYFYDKSETQTKETKFTQFSFSYRIFVFFVCDLCDTLNNDKNFVLIISKSEDKLIFRYLLKDLSEKSFSKCHPNNKHWNIKCQKKSNSQNLN